MAMTLEDYFDFIAPDDIRIRGHRIAIGDVLCEYSTLRDYLERTQRAWERQQQHPTPTLRRLQQVKSAQAASPNLSA